MAAAVVYGCVSVSTRLDSWGSGAVEIVEIATRKHIATNSFGLVGIACRVVWAVASCFFFRCYKSFVPPGFRANHIPEEKPVIPCHGYT